MCRCQLIRPIGCPPAVCTMRVLNEAGVHWGAIFRIHQNAYGREIHTETKLWGFGDVFTAHAQKRLCMQKRL
jgi:hypothetical protein